MNRRDSPPLLFPPALQHQQHSSVPLVRWRSNGCSDDEEDNGQIVMLSMMSTELSSSTSPDIRNVSDDRIHPQFSVSREHPRNNNNNKERFETTANGDVLIVRPSAFNDDSSNIPFRRTTMPLKNRLDWKGRNPKQGHDEKVKLAELRNQSDPLDTQAETERTATDSNHRNHTRHFFDATRIGRKESNDSADMYEEEENYNKESGSSKHKSRKHRRGTSNGLSNPSVAHRRVNSIGNSAFIDRRSNFHQREHSAGLDILSAAVVGASMDELAQAAGKQHSSGKPNWGEHHYQHPVLSSHHSFDAHSSYPHQRILPHSMQPPFTRRYTCGPHHHHQQQASPHHHGTYLSGPPGRSYSFPHSGSYGSSYGPPLYYSAAAYPVPSRHAVASSYAAQQQYPSQHSVYSPHNNSNKDSNSMYPPENRSQTAAVNVASTSPLQPEHLWANSNNDEDDSESTSQQEQRVGVAATVPVVSKSHTTLYPKGPITASTKRQSRAPPTRTHLAPKNNKFAHHRKMSSLCSVGLGTVFGSSIMSPDGDNSYEAHPLTSSTTTWSGRQDGHHRATSSTVSCMSALDAVTGIDDSVDETFLKNLYAWTNNDNRQSPSHTQQQNVHNTNISHSIADSMICKLAVGGTSKRVRRKCTMSGCPNRVVQGGLCISHGAKRKLCAHPGCDKNVKKAGLCSTHGPARKRCETSGCHKVAVQGGKCISHGAKKRLCEVGNCNKQAILGGMCKKHYDGVGGDSDEDDNEEIEVVLLPKKTPKKSHKATHTRGLSIFHDISADAVQSLLNTETIVGPSPSATLSSRPSNKMW